MAPASARRRRRRARRRIRPSPGFKAKIIHGVAYAPAYAPIQVQRAIWAGNQIRHKPYIYGGGHGAFNAAGYDCSGSVSYVLHAAGLLSTPMDSSDFESWGQHGIGQWITVYTNPATRSSRSPASASTPPPRAIRIPPPGTGPRWRPLLQGTSGFMARHPA